jgi:F0F1-type ATP synthase assembly protein I
MGLEFAAAVAGFALVGYWIDRHYDTSPAGVLIGAVLGLIGGTYNLVRESLAAFKRFERDGDSEPDQDEQD